MRPATLPLASALFRCAFLVLLGALASNVRGNVWLSSQTFHAGNRPYVATNEYVTSPYKLRVKIIGVPGYPDGFHAATSWNNNYWTIDSVPQPGTYYAELYRLQYAGDWSTLTDHGYHYGVTLNVQQTPVNNVAWSGYYNGGYNSIDLPPTGIPGQTISFSARVTNVGNTYWGGDYYLELKNQNGTPIHYASVNGVSVNNSTTVWFPLSLPTAAGVYTYTFTAMQHNVQYFGGTQYRTITVNRNPVTDSFSTNVATVSAGNPVILTSVVSDLDGNLTSQAIDYISPGGSGWVSGTVGTGMRWEGSGSGTNTLTKSMPLTQQGTWQFRARGGDALGGLSEFIYRNVNVTAAAPIVVNVSVDSSSIVAGQSTTARSTATPAGEIVYHGLEARLLPSGAWINWRVWNDTGGAQQSVVVSPATGSYELRAYAARADGNSTYSASASLNVQGPPVIVTQPSSQSVNSGQAATFSVSVSGTSPISYQWRKNGVDIPNATNASLAFSPAASADAANSPGYTVFVSNPHGSTVSSPAVLTVTTMPPIRLALQYWQPDDYPNREVSGGWQWQENVYHEPECHTEWRCHDHDGDPETDDECGDEEVCSDGGVWPDWVWVSQYAEDGLYGSRWDTTIGTFGHPPSTDAGAFRAWATGRGHALQSYPFAYQWQRFRAWASAPGGNCNNFSAALYNPSGAYMGSWSFGSGGYADIELSRWYASGFYRVDVSFSGATGTTPSSGTVTYHIALGVDLPPTISSSLVASVGSGANLNYTINASGSYSYWATGLPSGVIVNSSNGVLSGSTTQLGTHYVTISATNGNGTTNAVLVLTVNAAPPVINTQPVGKTGKPGTTVQLKVLASSDPAPQFQWKKNGTPMSAANNRVGIGSDQLTLTDLRPTDAGMYSVDVWNSSGSVTSQQAQLSVDPVPSPPPSITTHPANLERNAGQSATFTVVATGEGELRYQWFKNGQAIANATQNSYTLSSAQLGDSAIYFVEVFNDFGSVDSSCAALVVGSLTSGPQSVALTWFAEQGTPFVLDYPRLSPPLPGNVATHWAATGLPTGLSMNSFGRISGTPTTPGLFTGSFTASNSAGATTRQITLNVMTVNDAPWIPFPPVSASVNQYNSISLAVSAGSVKARPVSFQWRKDGVDLPGQTSHQFYVASAQSSDAGSYTVVASSTYNSSTLNTTSAPATVAVNTSGNTGSPATATIQFPIIVTRPDGSTSQIASPSAAVVPNAAIVGDTIRLTAKAADVDGDLFFLSIRTFSPHPENPATRGYWSYEEALNWVNVGGSVSTGNPLVYYYPQDENNQTNPGARTISFVVDSPGTWKIRIESSDTNNQCALQSISNSIDLAVSNPALTQASAITHPTRLVGAYVNAGQIHREWPEMWRPPTGRWNFKWGPNPVYPLKINWASPTFPAQNIISRFYLGWHGHSFPWLNTQLADEEATVRDLAAELSYAGVDFVIVDHTNLVFSYGTDSASNGWSFTNTDNSVTRATLALKNGLATYASATGAPRIRMTYLIGMTTAWYTEGMDGAHPALKLEPRTTEPGTVRQKIWSQADIDGFVANRTGDFNAFLQYLYDNYARHSDVWQYENGRPLLLIYVGTDGPAMHRNDSNASFDGSIVYNNLTSPFAFKITVGGTLKSINDVFAIKYTAALSSSRPVVSDPNHPENTLRNTISEVRTFGSVTRRYYKNHWTFREYEGVPMGTLNNGGTGVEVIHVTSYRTTSSAYFENELDVAVALKPKYLTIAAWNEFGSLSDEPSPEQSWTVMPNNKFGRRFSEIMRQKVQLYKAAP